MELCLDLQIEINLTDAEKKSLVAVENSLKAAAQVEVHQPVEVSVMIVDNNQIKLLNKQYRQVNQSTDVLSFPLWERDEE